MKKHGTLKNICELFNISDSLKEKYFTKDLSFYIEFKKNNDNIKRRKSTLLEMKFILNLPSKYCFATIYKKRITEFKIISNNDYGFKNNIYYDIKEPLNSLQRFNNIEDIFKLLKHKYKIKFNQKFKDEFNSMILLEELI